MGRKAQSELVGFAIIVIIVSIIILIFISLSLQNKPEAVQSYKTESFVQSALQYTTTCQENGHYDSYLDLIELCSRNGLCDNGTEACKVLDSTSENLVNSSWHAGSEFPVKGYDFSINYGGKDLVNIERGNRTSQSKGSNQVFSGNLQITFEAYY
jgi:competence protein ComGC